MIWMILQIVVATECLKNDYDPGYNMYLLVHSILPLIALVALKLKDNAAMRWVLFCTFTVTKIVGAHVGAIGPFISGGAYWNYRCVE